MAQKMNLGDNCCCGPSVSGLRRLTFPDGTQVGITGLDAVMEELYREGRPADSTTAQEMMERLEIQNYFAPSAQQTYQELFLVEYQRLLDAKTKSMEKEKNTMANQANNPETKKKGIFNLFRPEKKASHGNGCCDLKIGPVDEEEKSAEASGNAENKGKKDNPGSRCDCGGKCC